MALIVVLMTCVFLPTSASAAFSTSATVVPTSTNGAAHPDLTLTADFPGAPDLKSIAVTLPPGLRIAPGAVAAPCSLTDASNGGCDAATKIGTVTLTATGSVTGTGDLYMTAPPSSGFAAGIAIEANVSGGLGTFIAQGGVSLNLNGTTSQTQQIVFSTIPNTVGSGTPLHLTQLRVVLLGATGGTKPLVTNPSACPTSAASATFAATAFDGSAAQSVTAYPVTNCASIPASQTFDMTLSSANVGSDTDVKFTVNMPANSSSVSRWSLPLSYALTINYRGAGPSIDQCPSSSAPSTSTWSFDPSACPAQAKVGTITIDSPIFKTPASGDIYLIAKLGSYWFGIDLQSDGVSIRSAAPLSPTQIDPTCNQAEDVCDYQWVFAVTMPDLPFTKLKLNFNASGRVSAAGTPMSPDVWEVYNNCRTPDLLKPSATLRRGGIVATTFSVGLYGCVGAGSPPNTAFAPMPPELTKNARPVFAFTGSAGTLSFECAIDATAYSPCASGWSPQTDLSDGEHEVRVRAIGVDGPDPLPAIAVFTVDTAAPSPPSISSPSEGQTLVSTPVDVVFSKEPSAYAYCSVDASTFVACSSPFRTQVLANGNHTVAVRQTDAAGNVSVTASRNYVVASQLSVSAAVVPASTFGAAHPDLTITADTPGSPDLKSMTITLPPGWTASDF